ncbi:MAG: hypothetical protein FJ265_21175 [Planctomycetes bacterium]|nr:hypothetical protein [Planctomycetota bacterium]
MPRTLPLLSLLAALPVATAQTYTAHPIDNLASSTSQNIPIAGNSASWDEARSQFLWTAPFLPPAGGLLTAIELVPNVTGSTPYEQFEIWLDHTQNSTLSTTFANNLSGNQILVYSASLGSIQWTGGTWNQFVLQTPFAYDGQSNLVMEVRKKINRPNNPPTSTVSHRVLVWPRRADLPVPIWAYGAYGSGAANAAMATTSYNTQMLFRLQWLGTPTLAINSTRDITGNASRSYFHLGAVWTLTTRGLPNEFYLAAADFGLSPVGLPIPGLAGELWLLSPVIYGGAFLDPTGVGALTFTIPNDPTLVGVKVFLQNGVLGSTFAMTNAVDAPIAAY